MGRQNKGKRGRNSSTGLTPPSKMQNTNMADGSPQGQVQISQLIAQANESIYGQQQNMNPLLNNTYHVNHVNAANISPVPFSLAHMPFYNQTQDPRQSTPVTMSAPPHIVHQHAQHTLGTRIATPQSQNTCVQNTNPATFPNQSSPPQPTPTIQVALDMIFSTMNILNSRFDHFENETANKLSKLDILETINNRMESIEKGLSNLQNEVVVVKSTLNEHTETLRREEEHHNSIEQRLNFIDDERKHLERENEHLYEDLLRLKSHSMKYNLIFEGIPQETGENTEAVVKKFVKEKLEIDDDITFQNVHRLGKQPNRDKPRGIIARFSRYEDHERVRNAVPDKLKGTTYSVYQQYPKEIADRRRYLVPKLKQYKRQGRQAKIVYDRLIVDDVYFSGGDPSRREEQAMVNYW